MNRVDSIFLSQKPAKSARLQTWG